MSRPRNELAIRATAALLTATALTACPDSDALIPQTNNGIKLDGGLVFADAAPQDARPAPDAAADAGSPDLGTPDSGPSCVCPPLPTSCAPPATGEPAFSPDGLAAQLFSVIACSDQRLQIAIYETDWSCITDALSARLAADPDLTIELVFDDDRCPRPTGVLDCPLANLEGHPRVSLVSDDRSAYMHHKLAIADGRWVWVSSANFTQRSMCQDSNDGIVIGEPAIVAEYQDRFAAMAIDHRFGPIPAEAPFSVGPYRVHFGPQTPVDGPAGWFQGIIAAVDTASTSVDFLINAWTRPEIADALIRAHQRGLRVRGVVSAIYAAEAPMVLALGAGLPLKVGPMHHKLMVVDGRLVITGSPNWSQNAWQNNENSLWIEDPAIARRYLDRFEIIYAGAAPP